MTLFKQLVPPFARDLVGDKAKDSDNTSRENAANVGPVIRPRHEIHETHEAFGLTVYLPGVTRDGLDLTIEEGSLRVFGRRDAQVPANWTVLHRESADASFELVLSHDNAIDADKVRAELRDGVLRVALPKVEAIKPRKIQVS